MATLFSDEKVLRMPYIILKAQFHFAVLKTFYKFAR